MLFIPIIFIQNDTLLFTTQTQFGLYLHIMFKIILTITILLGFQLSYAQTPDERINLQLNEMKNSFLQGDFEKFIDFSHPDALKKFSNKDEAISFASANAQLLASNGIKITNISFKEPSKIITYNNELQFTIQQEISLSTPNGERTGTSTLIGISDDNGKTWKFIDTSGKTTESLYSTYPRLSRELVIKPRSQK